MVTRMKILISKHARARMKVYGFNDDAILSAVKHPDATVEGYAGRLVAHKNINHFIRTAAGKPRFLKRG